MRLSGATRESTKEAMSLLARRVMVAVSTRGEVSESVRATTLAPRSRAKCMACTVRLEYRGKLMPMTTSSGPTRSSCSKVSLTEVVRMRTTCSKIRLK